MAVGLLVNYYWYQIGGSDFFHSFFSTVCYRLENNEWGSKYSILMKELYQGSVKYESLLLLKDEISEIKLHLKKHKPDEIVWDIDDLKKLPPWGDDISEEITDLSNYFVTSSGDDLFELLYEAINLAIELKVDLTVDTV